MPSGSMYIVYPSGVVDPIKISGGAEADETAVSTYPFVATSIFAVGAVPTVTLPANHALPDQSSVWALLRELYVPLPTICAYLPFESSILNLPYTCWLLEAAIVLLPSA